MTVNGDGSAHAWTAATASLHALPSPPHACAVATLPAPGNKALAIGDDTGQVHLAGLVGQASCPAVRADCGAVLALCPLPGEPARIAAAGSSGVITIITIASSGQLQPGPILPGHPSPIRAMCLITHPDGRHQLAAAGNDATITIWDLTTPGTSPPASPAAGPLTGHDGWIWSLAAIPARPGTPPRLASAGADHTIRLWDPASGRPLGQPLTGHSDQVRAIITAVSHDGRLVLVSGGHDGTIRLWDPATGTPGTVIPLGIPVHALLQHHPDPASRQRTGGGATITAGLRTGIVDLDLHRDLFPAA